VGDVHVHDDFGEWAGAYALGALEPTERRAFEHHLETCPICTEEVRALLPLHGLLAQIDRAEVAARPDAEIADAIEARAGHEQQTLRTSRHRWRIAAVSTAAAVLLMSIAAGAVVVTREESDQPTWAEGPVVAAAITSTQAESTAVYTSARGWGTEVHVELLGLPQRSQYQLWVVGADGTWTHSSTWGPTPSGGANVTGATFLQTDAVDRIVVTSQDREEILIDADVT
jgi:anti-sigma-K factor RskA